MKNIIPISILTIIILFILPVSTGNTAHLTDPAFNDDLNIAPGSIVQFEHLSIKEGLSQNAGSAVFQDSQGYLWIGSQDGLNRYDGHTFKIFKHDPDDPNSISHNSILAIAEDRDGYLWIGTWGGGLNRFDPATEDTHDETAAKEAGADFIHKGASPDELIATLTPLLRKV